MVQTQLGRYRILRRLGSGGMREVFLASDNTLGRQVALKILTGDLAQNSQWKRRFVREAVAASRVTHPNVAVVYDAGETEDGQPFISLEYVEGETLRERLIRGKLSIDEIISIVYP